MTRPPPWEKQMEFCAEIDAVDIEAETIGNQHWRPNVPIRITVDFWQEDVDWALDLFSQVPHGFLRLDDDILHVKVDNGWARSQVIECDDERGVLITRLIEGHLEDECQHIATE